MELAPIKKKKKRRGGRQRVRDRIRLEFKFGVRRRCSVCANYFDDVRESLGRTDTMQADAFWKNYTVAQEWQKRHNITWWRSRCMALEYENEVLRDKVRSLFYQSHNRDAKTAHKAKHHDDDNCHDENNDEDVEEVTQLDLDDRNVECNVTEDMISILEQSEKHRRELQKDRKSKKSVCKSKVTGEVVSVERVRTRQEEAALLYGDASYKVLAMEAALQATTDNYKHKTKPQYWPNIPLHP